MTQHLQGMQLRLQGLHERIRQTALVILNQPAAALNYCAQLVDEVQAIESDHNTWANAYFTELRQIFGPNSPAEAQATGMASGVGRWLAQDYIHVLLCGATAAMLLGRHDVARTAALDGLQRCDALQTQPQPPDYGNPEAIKLQTELPTLRMNLLAQLMLAILKQTAGPPENPATAPEAEMWAARTYEHASALAPRLAAINGPAAAQDALLLAAEALTCAASAAPFRNDPAAFLAGLQRTVQFSRANGIALAERYGGRPYADVLGSWLRSAENTTDRTGVARQMINEIADQRIHEMAQHGF